MSKLPEHGKIACNDCFNGAVVKFDQTIRTEGNWRLKNNPLSWGGTSPEIIVLGFSKGQTQSGAMDKVSHEEIAYKGGRKSLGKILGHIGLFRGNDDELSQLVSREISNKNSRFHFGSLIRCGVEQLSEDKQGKPLWIGSGANMLGKFMKNNFGKEVISKCSKRYLDALPESVKLVVMLGTGSKLSYVAECYEAYKIARGGQWKWLNEVAYTDGKITVVHVEHFKSQGALIPQWLGEGKHIEHPRRLQGQLARDAVKAALLK